MYSPESDSLAMSTILRWPDTAVSVVLWPPNLNNRRAYAVKVCSLQALSRQSNLHTCLTAQLLIEHLRRLHVA